MMMRPPLSVASLKIAWGSVHLVAVEYDFVAMLLSSMLAIVVHVMHSYEWVVCVVCSVVVLVAHLKCAVLFHSLLLLVPVRTI